MTTAIQPKTDGKCDRCEMEGPQVENINMLGGYGASLCNRCRTEWHGMFNPDGALHANWVEIRANDDKRLTALAQTQFDGKDRLAVMDKLRADFDKHMGALFNAGREFVYSKAGEVRKTTTQAA